MKLDVYEPLLRLNAGFDQATRSLTALRKHGAFYSRLWPGVPEKRGLIHLRGA
jgi:hypothetical protein